MENTYWNGTGTYQKDYEKLVELMPPMGHSEVVAGELIRAASRLGYDFYNNGMGNNTSGALKYLKVKGVFGGTAVGRQVYQTIEPYTTGRVYRGDYKGDALQRAIESCVDMTIEFIQANPSVLTEKNDEDMFNYQAPYGKFGTDDDDD